MYLAFAVLVETPQVVLVSILLSRWHLYHDGGMDALVLLDGEEQGAAAGSGAGGAVGGGVKHSTHGQLFSVDATVPSTVVAPDAVTVASAAGAAGDGVGVSHHADLNRGTVGLSEGVFAQAQQQYATAPPNSAAGVRTSIPPPAAASATHRDAMRVSFS